MRSMLALVNTVILIPSHQIQFHCTMWLQQGPEQRERTKGFWTIDQGHYVLPGNRNPEGKARGISRGPRLYFIVFPDLSHNTNIFNYKSSIDLPGRSILEELIIFIAVTAGQYGKILTRSLSNTGELNFNIVMFSN